MPNAKALCIFTNLLGNKVMTSRLIATLNRLPELEPTFICIDVEDYKNFPAPWWARATSAWQAEFIARQKARKMVGRPFDLLLVNGWEMAVAFKDIARRVPSVAVMDAVPATVNAQLQQRGFKGLKRRLSHGVHHRSFGRAASKFDYFLAWGSDCADSLNRDYGVERDRCYLVLTPQDLNVWTPSPRSISPPIRLLFVGNDFARKGGDFLLRLYAEHLARTCTLTVASNDPSLEGRKLPPGVEWVRGRTRDQLLDVYRASDIFTYPTQQDYMPQVLGEALATGLPCLASDVGGIRDLVLDGETGFLFSRNATAEDWAGCLHGLIANPTEISRMARCARQFAEARLGLDCFERLVTEVIERLRAKSGQYSSVGRT